LDRSLNDWAVLALLVEQPRHGWAVARELRRGSALGGAWRVARAQVYRSLDALVAEGVARPHHDEPGEAGPGRTVMAATPTGRRQVRRWLLQPVDHLRDARTELLLKLMLCDRLGIDRAPLVSAQRAQLAPQLADLRRAARQPDADVVDRWRFELALAIDRFLDRA
jgi:DNA-binding PadR family transcriptional regulator